MTILSLFVTFGWLLIATAAAATAFVLLCRKVLFTRTRPGSDWLTVAFFHPFCNAGGGGERVLWMGLHGLVTEVQEQNDVSFRGTKLEFAVYSKDRDISMRSAVEKVEDRFGIRFSERAVGHMKFVHTNKAHLLDPARYPRFTMILQSLASMVVVWQCLRSYTPDVYVDTTGWAFTYFVAKVLAGCKVVNYTHYPTISTDMLSRVKDGTSTYNNSGDISKSQAKTSAKLLYYRAFAWLYGWMGKCSDVTMVNSNWTRKHITAIWGDAVRPHVVFPPCNTSVLERLPLFEGRDEKLILTVGQFRPEKDHALQIKAVHALQKKEGRKDMKLVLLGGCRNDGDQARVDALKALVKELGMEDTVEFKLNASFDELKKLLGRANLGLHTMWNEHFGIGVVEMMAAGVVTIAHNSGGPQSDIVTPYNGEETGMLASTAEEYAECMERALSGDVDTASMRVAARASVKRFSDEEFSLGFFARIVGLLHNVHNVKASK